MIYKAENHTEDTSLTCDVSSQLFMTPDCAHCPSVLDTLGKLVKEGLISQLQVINIAQHPDIAQAKDVRSVPWIQIGPYVLEGVHSPSELREWAGYASTGSGMGPYLRYLLAHHKLDQATQLSRESPSLLHDLVRLLSDLETPMGVRIGIGAIFESLQDTGLLADIVHPLGALTKASEPQIRADACHYLGLCASTDGIPYVRQLLDDRETEVSEIAAETLGLLCHHEH